VDGTKESGQVVEERVITSSDVSLDAMAIRSIDGQYLVGIDNGGKAAGGEVEELHGRALRLIDSHAEFRRLQGAQVFVFDGAHIVEQILQAVVSLCGPYNPGLSINLNSIQHG